MVDTGFGGGQPLTSILSNAMPANETVTAAAGSADLASRDDHKHPRLSSVTVQTLNASSLATITFTRTFTSQPGVICTYVEAADNQPVVFKVQSWTQDGSNNYTGCVIKGYRAQAVPQNLATLLLGGVFNLFAGSASGIQFSCVALMPSA